MKSLEHNIYILYKNSSVSYLFKRHEFLVRNSYRWYRCVCACACASVGLYDAWIEGNTVTINWCSITRRKTFPNSISCSSSNSRKAEKNNVTAYPILYCLPAFIGWNDTINKNDKVVRLLATAAAATVHNNCLFIAIEWNKRESMLNISPFIRGKEKVVWECVCFFHSVPILPLYSVYPQ